MFEDPVEEESLWLGGWPSGPGDFVFLIPAFKELGARLFGSQWQDELPQRDEYPVPPEHVDDTTESDHEDAHRFIARRAQNDPLTNSAKKKQKLNKNQWEEYFISVMSLKQEIYEETEMYNIVAKLLGDLVFQQKITPFLMHISGGDWQQSNRNDWIVPEIDTLRIRIQSGRMMPGHPGSVDGSHWIFLRQVEVDASLNWMKANRIAPEAPSAYNSYTLGYVSAAPATKSSDKQLIKCASEELTKNPRIAKAKLKDKLLSMGLKFSNNHFNKNIWPDARENSGLRRNGISGRKPLKLNVCEVDNRATNRIID